MHKKEPNPASSLEIPCLVRQKLCRTTSAYDSFKPSLDILDTRVRKRHKAGRPIVSAGGKPRQSGHLGLLSMSLPEHTLRAALENVSKAHDGSRKEDDNDDSAESENEQHLSGSSSLKKNSKNLKDCLSLGGSVGGGRKAVQTMKLDEMFEKAKLLLPVVRGESSYKVVEHKEDEVAVDSLEIERKPSLSEKKEWTMFSFCYECGRTSGVHLVRCPGCRSVSYCSRTCRSDNWKKGHQKECTGGQVKQNGVSNSLVIGKNAATQRSTTKATKRVNSKFN